MPLSHKHVGSKILAKIKMYTLTRAELLLNLCYEIFSTKKTNGIKSQITQDKCCHLTSFSGTEMALFENFGDIYAST